MTPLQTLTPCGFLVDPWGGSGLDDACGGNSTPYAFCDALLGYLVLLLPQGRLSTAPAGRGPKASSPWG